MSDLADEYTRDELAVAKAIADADPTAASWSGQGELGRRHYLHLAIAALAAVGGAGTPEATDE